MCSLSLHFKFRILHPNSAVERMNPRGDIRSRSVVDVATLHCPSRVAATNAYEKVITKEQVENDQCSTLETLNHFVSDCTVMVPMQCTESTMLHVR